MNEITTIRHGPTSDPPGAPLPAARSVAVIGGGVTGLVAARRLDQQGCSVTLFESGPAPGGQVRTVDFHGHALDVGAESLHLAGATVGLLDELGLSDQVVEAAATHAWIWNGRRLRRLPAGVGPAGPTRLAPLVRSGVLSPLGLARAALEPFVPRSLPTVPAASAAADRGGRPGNRGAGDGSLWDESVGDFIAGRFGSQVTERLVDPVLGSLHAGDVHRLSLRSATPLLAAKAASRRSLLLGSTGARHPSPKFASFAGGLVTLIDAILTGTSVEVRVGTPVDAVVARRSRSGGSRHDLWNANGHLGGFDGVVVALPAAAAAKVLGTLDGPGGGDGPSAPLARFRAASVATVLVGWDPAPARRCEALAATGMLTPARAGTLVKAATFLGTKWPHLRETGNYPLRISAGRAGDERMAAMDDDELASRLVDELRSATGLRGEPRHIEVYRWGAALPQLEVGHLRTMAAIGRSLEAHPRVRLAGAAYDGLGISSCISSAERAAEALLDRIHADDGTHR